MKLRRRVSPIVLLLLAISLVGSPGAVAQDAPSFVVTDLIKIVEEGTESIRGRVSALNSQGVAIGYSSNLPSKWSPFIAIDGEVERIKSGELGASIVDINDDGVIVGRTLTSRDDTLGALGTPTMWVDGVAQELPMPASAEGVPAYTGVARAINNDGVIVGEAWIEDEFQTQFAVIWTDGVPSTLPNAFAYEACVAYDISNNGHIAGQCWNPNVGQWQAVAWIDGQVAILDQGGYGFGFAAKIVDDPITGLPYVTGEVATVQDQPEDTLAVVWDLTLQIGDGTGFMTQLTPPEGMSFCSATSINVVDGDIWSVGYCSMPDGTDAWPTFAVLWAGDAAGAPLDDLAVDADAYTIQVPYDINESGTIAAVAKKGDVYRGILLTLEG